jgi:hypothetical protein
MSLEMAHKVIVPPKKNYIPQFLKQRDINSYLGAVKLGWGGGAQRPVGRGNKSKKMGARSAQART